MANIIPTPTWDDVHEQAILDRVLGGNGGATNIPLQNLANRTEYLYQFLIGASSGDIGGKILRAPFNATTGNYEFLNIDVPGSLRMPATVPNPFIYRYTDSITANGVQNKVVVVNTALTALATDFPSMSGRCYVYIELITPGGGAAPYSSVGIIPIVNTYITNSNINDNNILFFRKQDAKFISTDGAGVATERKMVIIGEVTKTGNVFSDLFQYTLSTVFYDYQTPIGSIKQSFAPNPPVGGWIKIDGSELIRSEYRDLFNLIGTTYGSTAANVFNLPDARGLFFRTLDGGRGYDPARALGSLQLDSFASHSHTIGPSNANLSIVTEADPPLTPDLTVTHTSSPQYTSGQGNNTLNNTGGSETRPKNIALYSYIKY